MPNSPTSEFESSNYIHDVGYEAFERQRVLESTLAVEAYRALSRKPFQVLAVDLSAGRRELKAGVFLAAAIALSRRWKDLPGERIGVVFPSSIGCSLTNLALTLLGKIPVNLNFTAGRAAIEASIKKAGITHVISAKPVIDRAPDFPWPEHVIDLVKERSEIKKSEVLKWLGLILTVPSSAMIRYLEIPRIGGDREAGLLFSSGSTGEPKGVVLTHKNVLANCLQIRQTGLLDAGETLMANLPTFHSFGFTVNMWYPLLTVLKTVMLPSPLETRRVAQAIADEKVTILMGTPTFLRPYFKRVEPELLRSLKCVVGGAEKTPAGFAERWEEVFGSRYNEGYGLTETSPVVSCNLPESKKGPARWRKGSVGQLFPGMRARIVDDATGKPKPISEVGVLHLQGANVFPGYLDDAESTAKAFQDGWFVTGDLARFDSDGYLYIEGRISRFSKIGGEMVPHGTVEQAVMRAFSLDESDLPLVAVTGIRDDAKGESLVLLSAVEIDANRLRERLIAAGIPNLWIPRRICRVDTIPCLASGKLDLKALERLAVQAVASCDDEV